MARGIYAIRKLRRLISPGALLQSYYAYVHSLLSYGVILWGNSTDSERVLILQKRAIRVLAGISKTTSCRDLFKFLKILMYSLYIYEVIMYVRYNIGNFEINDSSHNYSTRNSKCLKSVSHRLAMAEKDPDVIGPKLYEKLPDSLKTINSDKVFQRHLKELLSDNPLCKMTLRWGIISAGLISHDFVNAICSYPDSPHRVVAVAARDLKRAKAFAQLHGIEKAFDSYEELATCNVIDVAYIGALNPDHYRLCKLFLESGKHVLCEKPLCLNQKQVAAVVELAKKQKRFLMEAVWSRFFPAYYELEKEIGSGRLGEVSFVEVNSGIPIDYLERVKKRELGGSNLMDLGVYALQFVLFVFKEEPIRITSSAYLNDSGVDESVSAILEFPGGRRAVISAHSKLQLWNKATVVGTKGSTTVHDPSRCPEKITLSDGKELHFPLHSSSVPYNFPNSAGLAYQANEVKRCIDAGLLESPRMSHEESLRLAKLEDTIREQIGVKYDADDEKYHV